jgi:hypothetical protein
MSQARLRQDPVVTVKVLDAGPIGLSSIERYDDPDIEGALEHDGANLGDATFRLVDVDLNDLEDVAWLPGPKPWGARLTEALRAGATLPPVVIVATARADGKYGLLDGLNRTHAHWALGRSTIRAYELLEYRRPW